MEKFPDAPARFELAVRSAYTKVLKGTGLDSLDVGAHKGKHTIPLAGVSTNVIAVQPIPHKMSLLIDRASELKIKNIVFLPVLAGSKIQISSFSHFPQDPGKSSSKPRHSLAMADSVTWKTLELPLDGFLDAYTIGSIKIDAEGHEVEILAGTLPTIKSNLPVVHCEVSLPSLEAHQKQPKEIFDFFESLGYSCFSIFGHLADREIFEFELSKVGAYDFIFVPNKYRGVASLSAAISSVWR